MSKFIIVKGGIIWGWIIRRKSEKFKVIDENDVFYKVVPVENITVDFNFYNELIKDRKFLLVPKSFTEFGK